MVSPIWSRLLFGHGRDTPRRAGWLAGSLCVILLISWLLVAPLLANLAFDGFPIPPLFEDLGVFAAGRSVVFVSALNAYTRGGLVASFAVGLAPSAGFAVVGLFTEVLGMTDSLGDTSLWTFVFLLLPLLTLPLALAGFVLGLVARFVVNATTG